MPNRTRKTGQREGILFLCNLPQAGRSAVPGADAAVQRPC